MSGGLGLGDGNEGDCRWLKRLSEGDGNVQKLDCDNGCMTLNLLKVIKLYNSNG